MFKIWGKEVPWVYIKDEWRIKKIMGKEGSTWVYIKDEWRVKKMGMELDEWRIKKWEKENLDEWKIKKSYDKRVTTKGFRVKANPKP